MSEHPEVQGRKGQAVPSAAGAEGHRPTDRGERDLNHYTYRVTWSAQDEEFLATVAEFPSLSWLAGDPARPCAASRR